jgi:hypothetical protein
MKNWLRWYVVLILLILAAYLYAEYKRPPVINWTPTLVNQDKIPYGTYILFEQLESMLGKRPEELRMPMYDLVNNREDSGEVYMLICPDLATTGTDEQELLRYISRGNTVFIATESISKSLADTLKVDIRPFDIGTDSPSLRMVNPSLGNDDAYLMRKHTVDGYFRTLDTARAEVLGMNTRNRVNYVRYRFGPGQLLLHTAPLAFSNYFILKDSNSAYVEKALAYIPRQSAKLFWDEFYKSGRGGASTPLRVILTRPALRAAYFIALASILLYVLFQSKRRQRIIPVLEQPRNDSMDFVETVSRVYYNQANHGNIAHKKMQYFLDMIRTRYGLQTQVLDEQFEHRLCQKSGYPADKVRVLVSVINQVRQQEQLTPEELMQFSRLIDEFQKQVKS